MEAVPNSTSWKNLTVTGDDTGIGIRRKPSGESRYWLADLWLAERLADAA